MTNDRIRYEPFNRASGVYDNGWNVWDNVQARWVSKQEHTFLEAREIADRLNRNVKAKPEIRK